MRDPVREIDLMVLGDVGASTLRERRRGAGQGGDGAGHGRDTTMKGGGGIRPMTNDHPGAVMRNPVRDPMRGVDLMVLGYVVGASTPLQAAPGNRGQFASRTREPASRLLPLMARTPSFKAQSMF